MCATITVSRIGGLVRSRRNRWQVSASQRSPSIPTQVSKKECQAAVRLWPLATLVFDSGNNIVYVNIHLPTSIMPTICSPFIGRLGQTASGSKSPHMRHVLFSDTFIDLLSPSSDHPMYTYTTPTMIRCSAYLIFADRVSSRKMKMAIFR